MAPPKQTGQPPEKDGLPAQLEGGGPSLVHFSHLDMRFRIKMRAFIDLFMPNIYGHPQAGKNFDAMRQEGIFPLMYYLDFHSAPHPTRMGLHQQSFTATLRRHRQPPSGGKPGRLRLLIDFESSLRGEEGSGRAEDLTGGPAGGPQKTAATARIVQMLSRPLAPPSERNVERLPPHAQTLQILDWEGPFPSAQALLAPPPEAARQETGPWASRQGVWGMANTDPNQHVNMINYVIEAENQFAHLLHGAGRPPLAAHIQRAEMLFMRPFFGGDVYTLEGQLYVKEETAWMVAAFYHTGQAEKPCLAMRMEARLGERQP